MSTPQHHECFYFTLITFLVENCLFRVPHSCLAQSEVFRDLFLLPVGAHEAEGRSDANPIVLEGIKKGEFESLLKVLCPMPVTSLPDRLPLSLDQWKDVLKLSKMWGFNSVHNFTIDQMEPLLAQLPLDKVALSQEYGITKWLVPGLVELARRAEPVGPEDVQMLGLDTALKLAEVRESSMSNPEHHIHRSARPHQFGGTSGFFGPPESTVMTATGPRGATTCDFTDRVRKVFQVGLETKSGSRFII